MPEPLQSPLSAASRSSANSTIREAPRRLPYPHSLGLSACRRRIDKAPAPIRWRQIPYWARRRDGFISGQSENFRFLCGIERLTFLNPHASAAQLAQAQAGDCVGCDQSSTGALVRSRWPGGTIRPILLGNGQRHFFCWVFTTRWPSGTVRIPRGGRQSELPT